MPARPTAKLPSTRAGRCRRNMHPRCIKRHPRPAALAIIAAFVALAAPACGPADLIAVVAPAHSEPVPTAVPASSDRTRPGEYATVPPPEVVWSYEAEAGAPSEPALVDGALYVTARNYVRSLDVASGKLRWLSEIPGAAASPPVVADGVIYVSAEYWNEQTPKTGLVVALDASNGDLIWRYDIPRGGWDELMADPVLADGVLYVGSFNGNMYALDAATGALSWSFAAGDVIRWRATVAHGLVYFGSVDRHVYALDAATGELRWRYETEGPQWVGPVVADGLVYAGVGQRHLYALDAATGALRWQHESESDRLSLPVVSHGVVYVSANEDFSEAYQQGQNIESIRHHGYVTALNARTGRPLWQYRTEGDPSISIVVDGVVYVSAGDERSYLLEDPPESGNPAMRSRVYALDAATGALVWQRRVVAETSGGARGLTVADETVYVESSDQFRYNDPGNPPVLIHGQLSAFDADTGESNWLFETDDQFAIPPTVADGVAYATTINGQVHALRDPAGH